MASLHLCKEDDGANIRRLTDAGALPRLVALLRWQSACNRSNLGLCRLLNVALRELAVDGENRLTISELFVKPIVSGLAANPIVMGDGDETVQSHCSKPVDIAAAFASIVELVELLQCAEPHVADTRRIAFAMLGGLQSVVRISLFGCHAPGKTNVQAEVDLRKAASEALKELARDA
eukprot:SAG11_NODE_8868_length_968_cov_1.063291_1_plen_176_part_10